MSLLRDEFKRARDRSATVPGHARPALTRALHEATDRDRARAATEHTQRAHTVATHIDTLDEPTRLKVLASIVQANPDAVIDALNEIGEPLP